MRLQRLFDMSPAELAFRGRQEVFKAVERLSAPEARKNAACRYDRSVIDASLQSLLTRSGAVASPGAAAALQAHLQEKMGGRFFAGLEAGHSPAQSRHRFEADPAASEHTLIARADAVCGARFEILAYGALSFGQPINWHLDPVSGKESPSVHWSRLDPLAPGQVGDSKVVWELNRHQWLLDLGQAFELTGDEQYADVFIALVTDWVERNPFARGINWSSALEVAMRLISWCWALAFFKGSDALTPERFQAILAGLQRHADFVERNLSRYFSPNTHLTVEALALYYAGTLLPELHGAGRWRETGRHVLLEQLPVQVPEGGVYFEQSTRYQYYTVEIYLHFAILAARNNDPLPDLVNERLREMLHFLLDVRRPDGTVPQIGDTDGGWLCPLLRREVGDYRGLFATAALFLKDARLAGAATSNALESLYLLGDKAGKDWPDPGAELPSPQNAGVLHAGACVVMRSGGDTAAHQLIFDTGPLGCHVSGGHGHADLLAVQCSAFGENYLVDPGTGCYTADSAWRRHFRSTGAHSTLMVDGLDQAEPDGPFSWRERPVARLLEFTSDPGLVYAAAQHDAYTRLADPVRHQRRVWFIDKTLWLVVDDVFGAARHQLDLRFQFAPLPVLEEADGWVRAQSRAMGSATGSATGSAGSLLLKTFAAQPLRREIVSGASEPPVGWYSPNYGQVVPAPALTVSLNADLPLRLATLIIPMRDADGSPPPVETVVDRGLLCGLGYSEPVENLPGLPDFGSSLPLDNDKGKTHGEAR